MRQPDKTLRIYFRISYNHLPIKAASLEDIDFTTYLNKTAKQSTYNAFDYFVFVIHPVDFVQMVAEVQHFKPPVLAKQCDECTTGPVQPFSKHFSAKTKQGAKQLHPSSFLFLRTFQIIHFLVC